MHHLVDETSQSVEINSVTIAVFCPNLGSHILFTTAVGVREVIIVKVKLTEPEVSQSSMPLEVYHDILGLKVSVDNFPFMELLERQHHLRCI